jgi:hypothetical protein
MLCAGKRQQILEFAPRYLQHTTAFKIRNQNILEMIRKKDDKFFIFCKNGKEISVEYITK